MRFPIVFLTLCTLWLSACGLADLRTEELALTGRSEEKARELLRAAWRQQGLDQLENHQTYEVVATDHWKGLMGGMSKIWPVNRKPLRLRYAIGSFDGSVEILEGGKEGFRAGLQSWRYYEAEPGDSIAFQSKPDKRIAFGLAAFQYFFELSDRLLRAPILRYAGSRNFAGQTYDLVFATWQTPEPHRGHDQYLLYINRQSGLLEIASYTIRHNYLPAPGNFYGSIRFGDFREIDGVQIPFRQTVFLNAPKEKEKKYLHQLTIRSFAFDAFDKNILYPDPKLEFVGDDKPE